MIVPVAKELGISLDNVYANSLRWDDKGEFSSFDPQVPTKESSDTYQSTLLSHMCLRQFNVYATSLIWNDKGEFSSFNPPVLTNTSCDTYQCVISHSCHTYVYANSMPMPIH